ncbi:fructosamine kinase [Euzebyella marina]|uniref:Fructosamine kinase n=1 Tax=Euzebyella marina TaxID=1761453 RepID=A0A3G2L1C6_9FLAO|nr:fructosamine kinase family protein [Euzebyella marina]AYN66045.1 fructosamine kinase [Euzebyella marina]
MDKSIRQHIEYLLCIKIESIRPLSGGDISKAYLIQSENENLFCKIHLGDQAFEMFRAERLGLQALGKTKSIGIPKVLLCEQLEKGALLVMEYIEPRPPSAIGFEKLGHQLAALHQPIKSEMFGFESENFIGSLPQSNQRHSNWSSFYVKKRLLPQLKIAQDLKRLERHEVPSENTLQKICDHLFPDIEPSLLHGDLWSGNFLISKSGEPFLIDPAVYYGHNEVDLAMTRLFGGFSNEFYEAYREVIPAESGEKERCDLYQLYYLLVHLNLFGSSYKGSVTQILRRYF